MRQQHTMQAAAHQAGSRIAQHHSTRHSSTAPPCYLPLCKPFCNLVTGKTGCYPKGKNIVYLNSFRQSWYNTGTDKQLPNHLRIDKRPSISMAICAETLNWSAGQKNTFVTSSTRLSVVYPFVMHSPRRFLFSVTEGNR